MQEKSYKELKRQCSLYKKYLIELTNSTTIFLTELDKVMLEKESGNRGQRIAKLWNYLNFQNDSAKHFGLNIPLNKLHPKNENQSGITKQPVIL